MAELTVGAQIELDDLQDGYRTLLDIVTKHGEETAPRGMRTRELLCPTITLNEPLRSVPVGIGRGINLAIGAAETAMLIGGLNDAHLLARIAPNFQRFIEYDRFYGAYGPRIFRQVPVVIKQLIKDQDTRQAVIQIFRPDDLYLDTVDLPCTVELQYFIRNEKLTAVTRMRSNDIIWGVAYDIWQFTYLQAAIARALGREMGPYIHQPGSLHFYVDRDAGLIDKLHAYDGTPHPPPPVRMDYEPKPRTLDQALGRWAHANSTMEAAAGVRAWVPSHDSSGPCPQWYRDQLTPHLSSEGRLCAACRYVLPDTAFYWNGVKRSSCRWCMRDMHRKAPIGTTARFMLIQRGACAICHAPFVVDFYVDHDHRTGQVRGLLCSGCNTGLGHFHDNVEVLKQAASYIEAGTSIEWMQGSDWSHYRSLRDGDG